MAVQAILAAGQIVGELGKTVASISDIKKRREFEQALAVLSIDEQRKLNQDISKATSQSKRLEILANSISEYKKAQLQEQGKKETRLALVVLGGGLLLILAVYLLNKK